MDRSQKDFIHHLLPEMGIEFDLRMTTNDSAVNGLIALVMKQREQILALDSRLKKVEANQPRQSNHIGMG